MQKMLQNCLLLLKLLFLFPLSGISRFSPKKVFAIVTTGADLRPKVDCSRQRETKMCKEWSQLAAKCTSQKTFLCIFDSTLFPGMKVRCRH